MQVLITDEKKESTLKSRRKMEVYRILNGLQNEWGQGAEEMALRLNFHGQLLKPPQNCTATPAMNKKTSVKSGYSLRS